MTWPLAVSASHNSNRMSRKDRERTTKLIVESLLVGQGDSKGLNIILGDKTSFKLQWFIHKAVLLWWSLLIKLFILNDLIRVLLWRGLMKADLPLYIIYFFNLNKIVYQWTSRRNSQQVFSYKALGLVLHLSFVKYLT